ncbi:MAG: hypothetical protein RID09_07230 [Coleofasciculus sp. G1-WW12-02]|uniref:hypothetical protein n=1 Tax=unclassified Coleofasciculus TaxID=2692782 RepID=UPI00330436C0
MPRCQTLGFSFLLPASLTAPDHDPERLCKNLLSAGAKWSVESVPLQVRSLW